MKRVATYIRNTIKYRRRKDLEQENGHLIIIDIGTTKQLRVINIYRPFNPTNLTEKAFFLQQLNTINGIITKHTILLGDFNLDLNT